MTSARKGTLLLGQILQLKGPKLRHDRQIRSLHGHRLSIYSSTNCISCQKRPALSLHGHRINLNIDSHFRRSFLRSSIRHKTSTSALFIRSDDLENANIVEVDLNLSLRLKDVKKLEENLKARKMNRDIKIYELAGEYKFYRDLREERERIEEAREQVAATMKKLIKGKNVPPQELEARKEALILKGRQLREDYKKKQRIFVELEDKVMSTGTLLPSDLHPDTPLESLVEMEIGDKPAFSYEPKSHIDLGRLTKTLEFVPVSPSGYYLKGRLALLDLHLADLVTSNLIKHGLVPFSSPDFVKSLVVEACGRDFQNPKHVFTLEQKLAEGEKYKEGRYDITYHLAGGASPFSFAAYFTKMNIKSECLPLRCFAAGHHYVPETVGAVETHGLFGVRQTNRVALFGVTRNEDEMMSVYHEYKDFLIEMYKEFELPLRIVNVGAPNLLPPEAARTDIEVWMPSLKNYFRVAHVSSCSNFVSRRLMIKHNQHLDDIYSRNYVHTVHGTALNATKLIAAIMENHQVKVHGTALNATKLIAAIMENHQVKNGIRNFKVPKCLRPPE